MEARMHSLEDALGIINGSHPLLDVADDDEDDEPTFKPIVQESTSALTDALGTLCIDGEGSFRFFGPSGGSEVRPFAHRIFLMLKFVVFRAYWW